MNVYCNLCAYFFFFLLQREAGGIANHPPGVTRRINADIICVVTDGWGSIKAKLIKLSFGVGGLSWCYKQVCWEVWPVQEELKSALGQTFTRWRVLSVWILNLPFSQIKVWIATSFWNCRLQMMFLRLYNINAFECDNQSKSWTLVQRFTDSLNLLNFLSLFTAILENRNLTCQYTV